MTLNTEAGKESPKSIKIKSEDFKIDIYQCGRRSLAIVMMEEDFDTENIKDYINQLKIEFGLN